jgi:hypothetical protein
MKEKGSFFLLGAESRMRGNDMPVLSTLPGKMAHFETVHIKNFNFYRKTPSSQANTITSPYTFSWII